MTCVPKRPGRTEQIKQSRIAGTIERYKAQYPTITDLIRRVYSAERIAELVYCDVWVAKMIKFSGRF